MLRREAIFEIREELVDLLPEVIRQQLAAVALERGDRLQVGARRAADPEVDPLAVQPPEHAERLRDFERAVVRQHHAAAPHPDASRRGRDCGDQDLGRGAREHGRAVMLGHPVAPVPKLLGEAGQVDRVLERLRPSPAVGNR